MEINYRWRLEAAWASEGQDEEKVTLIIACRQRSPRFKPDNRVKNDGNPVAIADRQTIKRELQDSACFQKPAADRVAFQVVSSFF